MSFVDYESAGLVLRSAIPIAAPLANPQADPSPDRIVTIEAGEPRAIPFERPSTDVVSELIRDGVAWFTVCRTGDSYVGRFFGVCDFEIGPRLDHVVCYPAIEGHPDIIPVLLTGTIAAIVLTLRGWCVLHASAVEVDGRAVAFVGASGQGKSTVAALLCAAGAPLVTDDVLPVELGEADGITVVHVLRSTHELRIRPKAHSLLERFDGQIEERLTADERHAITPLATASRRLELATIAVPLPDRELEVVRARRLPPSEATLWLGRCGRVDGWQRAAELRKHFLDVTRIVASVPVLELSVPWGPPFAPGLAEQILDIVR